MPIGLSAGWNQIQFNLADFTKRAYGTQFQETLRVQVHANARLRRIYFCERLFSEEELPQDYKLYLPLEHKQKKTAGNKDKGKPAPTSAAPPSPPTPQKQIAEPAPKITSPKEELSQSASVHTTTPIATDIAAEEPPLTKEEPPLTKEEPPLTKEEPPLTKEEPLSTIEEPGPDEMKAGEEVVADAKSIKETTNEQPAEDHVVKEEAEES
ncbi:unnamed protein product, partial [Iphiclides podalirius]